MIDFEITGLPRSGTAWLANTLSLVPEIMCYHEADALNFDWELDEVSQRYDYVGNSSCNTAFTLRWDAPVKFYIFRPWEDCKRSLGNAGIGTKGFENIAKVVHDYARENSEKLIKINFEDLFQVETIELILREIGFTGEIPTEKIKQACRMNVQLSDLEYRN